MAPRAITEKWMGAVVPRVPSIAVVAGMLGPCAAADACLCALLRRHAPRVVIIIAVGVELKLPFAAALVKFMVYLCQPRSPAVWAVRVVFEFLPAQRLARGHHQRKQRRPYRQAPPGSRLIILRCLAALVARRAHVHYPRAERRHRHRRWNNTARVLMDN